MDNSTFSQLLSVAFMLLLGISGVFLIALLLPVLIPMAVVSLIAGLGYLWLRSWRGFR